MRDAEIDAKWALANKVSDRIIDMINEERAKPGFNPTQVLAGQMLALMGFMITAPKYARPREFDDAGEAINRCLKSMMESL